MASALAPLSWNSGFHVTNPLVTQQRARVPMMQSQTLTVGLVCGKVKTYCQTPRRGVGDKPQIYPNLVFEFGGFVFFFFLRLERSWGHHFVTFSPPHPPWHFLVEVLGIWMFLVYDSLARWSMAWGGLLPHLVLEKHSLHINGDISSSNLSILTMLSTAAVLVIWLWLVSS